jgi:IS5 family transposase
MYTGLKEQLDLSENLIIDILPQHHNLIKLKKILNWKKINKIYQSCFKSKKGRGTKETDLVIGLMLLKFLYKKSDRLLIEELEVNNAFLHFCSVSLEDLMTLKEKNKIREKEKKKLLNLIDHSTLVKARKRLGAKNILKIEKTFTDELIENNIIDGKLLLIDTTSLEKNIIYPTEISLLKRVIEHGEMVIQKIIKKKEILKNDVIKKTNQICKVYYSAGKKTKKLLISSSKDLLKIAEETLEKVKTTMNSASDDLKASLKNNSNKVLTIGQKIIDQTKTKIKGKAVKNKIVSFYEDHASALPKGKIHKTCEFGSKLEINMSGNGYITSHKLHKGNPADVGMLSDAINRHYEKFPEEFKECTADRGFYDSELIDNIEDVYKIDVAIPHKKRTEKVFTKKKKKLYNKRAAIEAKISEGKRCYGLNKSYFKGHDGDIIWETLSIFSLNINKLLRDIKEKPKLMLCF